jgi:hypothetical protein
MDGKLVPACVLQILEQRGKLCPVLFRIQELEISCCLWPAIEIQGPGTNCALCPADTWGLGRVNCLFQQTPMWRDRNNRFPAGSQLMTDSKLCTAENQNTPASFDLHKHRDRMRISPLPCRALGLTATSETYIYKNHEQPSVLCHIN